MYNADGSLRHVRKGGYGRSGGGASTLSNFGSEDLQAKENRHANRAYAPADQTEARPAGMPCKGPSESGLDELAGARRGINKEARDKMQGGHNIFSNDVESRPAGKAGVKGQQMASSIFAAEPEPASAPSGMSEAKRKALYSTSVFAEAPETSAAPKASDAKKSEQAGNDIFGEAISPEDARPRSVMGGVRKPPGGGSSLIFGDELGAPPAPAQPSAEPKKHPGASSFSFGCFFKSRQLIVRPQIRKSLHRVGQNYITARAGIVMEEVRRYKLKEGTQLVLQMGDITEWEGDAIVNAANEAMLGGGGVDGAIHRAAGSQLRMACQLFPSHEGKRCLTGDARVTLGYELPARFVIHTVGPRYNQSKAKACQEKLMQAYRSSLACANGVGCQTVAFPAVSCGVYGYPEAEGAKVALTSCQQFAWKLEEVHFVLFGRNMYQTFTRAAEEELELVELNAEATPPPEKDATPPPAKDATPPPAMEMYPADADASAQ